MGKHFDPPYDKYRSVFVKGLLQDLGWWSRSAGLVPGALFFSKVDAESGLRKNLTASMMNQFCKLIARQQGLEEKGFSSHSLRVGGAETMWRDGVDRETINAGGRWAIGSSAAVGYRNAILVSQGATRRRGFTSEEELGDRRFESQILESSHRPTYRSSFPR